MRPFAAGEFALEAVLQRVEQLDWALARPVGLLLNTCVISAIHAEINNLIHRKIKDEVNMGASAACSPRNAPRTDFEHQIGG
jgi:hypothetical protein